MKTRSLAAALGISALLLAGCGTTEPSASSDAPSPSAPASGECKDDTTKTATGPVSLTDSFGRKVELDEPASRVAVLEWQQIEDSLSLCVTPVAVADAKGYSTWVTAEKLPKDVTDIGDRSEPNLEALFATNPDLVIIEAYTAKDEIIKQLEKYDVPVLATKGADAQDPIANMLDTFNLIAEATGRQERAKVVEDEFNTALADAEGQLSEGGSFVYFDTWLDGGNIAVRPFGQGSLIGEIGERLGLKNAWKGKVDPAYGLGQTDIEGMSELGDATFLHTGTVDPDGDAMAELAKNPVWKKIPAVQEGRVHAFDKGIWTFGGPRSSEQIIDAYVASMKK